MSAATLTAFRPRDDSVGAVQNAIGAVSEERRAAVRRLAELRTSRGKALLVPTATAKQIAGIEGELRDTEILIERLDTMRPDLETKLTTARETAQMAEINRLAALAGQAIAEYQAALDAEYPELAGRIADILRMGRRAQAAASAAQHAAAGIGGQIAFDIPAIADLVVLPSKSPAAGMIWGKLPLPEPLVRY